MDTTLFIGLVIAGATDSVKNLLPGRVYGVLTVVVALVIGAVIATIDTQIGLPDITVAQGITTALGAIGAVTVAKKIG